MGKIKTNPNFWDCECKHNYIHPKETSQCPVCLALKEERPESREEEVEVMIYTQYAANQFNKFYAIACETSEPRDWMQCSLYGRNLVNELTNQGLIKDNFREVHNKHD